MFRSIYGGQRFYTRNDISEKEIAELIAWAKETGCFRSPTSSTNDIADRVYDPQTFERVTYLHFDRLTEEQKTFIELKWG